MWQVDAVHRRAEADSLVEEDDGLVRMLFGEPRHEVELGADRPRRSGGRGLDGLDDELGGADQICGRDDVMRALGVDEHRDTGDACAHLVDALTAEAAVYGAVPLP